MSETKPRKNSHMRFALSIYMKYGEVLHKSAFRQQIFERTGNGRLDRRMLAPRL